MNFFINDAGGLKIGILGLLLVVFHSHSSVFPGSFLYLPNSPSFESELNLFFLGNDKILSWASKYDNETWVEVKRKVKDSPVHASG